jgi:NTE family protein
VENSPSTDEVSPNTALESLFEGSGKPEEIGLALSGGGIRATLFHLGAIRRLNEMGHLGDIDRIASVSGGAIATGLLAKGWKDLKWEDGRATNLEQVFQTRVMRLAKMPLDIPIVLLGLIPFVSPAKLLARVLDLVFFRGMTLQALPSSAKGEKPRFIFNASDLATGTLFRFEQPYMGTYRVGLIDKPKVKIATAVAASSAFPPIVSPLNLDMDPDKVIDPDPNGRRRADLHGRLDLRRRAALVDGGAYDNLALEPITGRCHVYLVSDAGGNLKIDPPSWKWWFWSLQLFRTLDIAVSQDRALRRSSLFDHKTEHPVALWRTVTNPKDASKYPAITPFPVHKGWPEYLSTRSTRLWPFSMSDRKWLVNWGYVTADVLLRSFIWPHAEPPVHLPFEDATFAGPPPTMVPIAGQAVDPSGLL